MAIPVNIEELVNCHVVESTRIEFKAGFNPNPVMHAICAFANDIDNIGGGYIVIGIEERDGVPLRPARGIEQGEVDGVLKRLVGLCHCLEPLYNPVVQPVALDGVTVIVIWCPGGHSRPYKVAKDVLMQSSQKQYYIRKFASTVVASPQEEKDLFYVATDIPFDDRPNLIASVDDLDLGLLREHLKAVGSSLYRQSEGAGLLEVAEDMRLIAGPPEDLHPLNVGLLMFCEHPDRFFRYARIEVVDIPHPSGASMTEKVFSGPIQRQLADALAYINNYVIKSMTVKGTAQTPTVTVDNYPYVAVKEILSNAVYHHSYQVHEPITVRITPAAMEITSFPGFDRSITDEDLAKYHIRSRVYRNRRIGDFLKELQMIEGRNTGFPNAFAALEENGSPMPTFEMDEGRGFLSVTIPIHPAFDAGQGLSAKEREYRDAVTSALGDGPLTLTELARVLGYKGISKKLAATVDELVRTGVVDRVVGAGRTNALALRRK